MAEARRVATVAAAAEGRCGGKGIGNGQRRPASQPDGRPLMGRRRRWSDTLRDVESRVVESRAFQASHHGSAFRPLEVGSIVGGCTRKSIRYHTSTVRLRASTWKYCTVPACPSSSRFSEFSPCRFRDESKLPSISGRSLDLHARSNSIDF